MWGLNFLSRAGRQRTNSTEEKLLCFPCWICSCSFFSPSICFYFPCFDSSFHPLPCTPERSGWNPASDHPAWKSICAPTQRVSKRAIILRNQLCSLSSKSKRLLSKRWKVAFHFLRRQRGWAQGSQRASVPQVQRTLPPHAGTGRQGECMFSDHCGDNLIGLLCAAAGEVLWGQTSFMTP